MTRYTKNSKKKVKGGGGMTPWFKEIYLLFLIVYIYMHKNFYT